MYPRFTQMSQSVKVESMIPTKSETLISHELLVLSFHLSRVAIKYMHHEAKNTRQNVRVTTTLIEIQSLNMNSCLLSHFLERPPPLFASHSDGVRPVPLHGGTVDQTSRSAYHCSLTSH